MTDTDLSETTPSDWGFDDVQRLLGDGVCLVVSGGDPDDGGLFAISRGEWETLDTVPSVGVAFDGTRFARSLGVTPGDPAERASEIIWYDAHGMTRMERVDGLWDLHDLAFDPSDPEALLVVSTGTNSVCRLRTGRPPETIMRPGALGDGGHRNCLARQSGLTYVTAFSTTVNHRKWLGAADIDSGVLLEVETGRVVIEGLCRPHSPLRTVDDDGWIIANSGRGELIWESDDGDRSILTVGDWPQDVIRCGQHLLVGVSAVRKNDDLHRAPVRRALASVVVIDEATRTIVADCPLPVGTLYDLVVVPESMVDGLRIGTGTNGLRLLDRSLSGVMSEPVTSIEANGPEDHVGEVVVTAAPSMVVLGDDFTVSVRAVYRGTRRGKTFGDRPILLGLRWRGSEVEARHVFQSVLIPDRVIEFDVVVGCPATTGRHTLEIGFLQELVAWFGTTAVVHVDVVDDVAALVPDAPVGPDLGTDLTHAATRRQLKRSDVAGVGSWWHSIDLGDGVVTPGHKDPALIAQEWADLDLPVLRGRSVLDIGAWDGYFSFTAERSGAERVVAVDDWMWALRRDRFGDMMQRARDSGPVWLRLREQEELWDREGLPGKAGFDVCHRHLSSGVESIVANYMDLDPAEVGTFDVVLYLGVLYHEPNPLASMECVRALTRGVAVVETSALFVPGFDHLSLAEFYPTDELNGDITNWWSPNVTAVRGMAHAAGFSRTLITKAHPPEWDALPAGSPPMLYRLMLHCYAD